MNHPTPFADRIQRAFEPSRRGVVGLVDDLLGLCRDQQLRFDFRDGRCYVRPLGTDVQEPVEVPLRKSVFRAVLARVAALCNEQRPDSVTPYRGEGELSIGTGPPAALHVAFTNGPDEQRLEVTPAARSAGEANAPGTLPVAAGGLPTVRDRR